MTGVVRSGRKLIINADGFGFSYGANMAIFEAAAAGAITSISVNTNFEAVNQLLLFHATYPHISIGVHLNPIVGKPVSRPEKIPSLLDPDGEFWNSHFLRRLRLGHIKKDELLHELTKQTEKVLRMGIPVSHLDSHQNSHLHPWFFPTFLNVAKATGISRMRAPLHRICIETGNPRISPLVHYSTHPRTAARHFYTLCLSRVARLHGLKMADRLVAIGHANGKRKTDYVAWQAVGENLPAGTNEIYCHPGFPDETLRRYATYVEERRKEHAILLSPDFKEIWKRNNIELISFNEL